MQQVEITGDEMGKNNNVVVLDNEIANKLSQLDTISLKLMIMLVEKLTQEPYLSLKLMISQR